MRNVYIIQGDRYFKIGVSKDVNSRLVALDATLLPFELKIIATLPTDRAFELESSLHERFSLQRVRGEWFDLDLEDIKSVVSEYIFKIENGS